MRRVKKRVRVTNGWCATRMVRLIIITKSRMRAHGTSQKLSPSPRGKARPAKRNRLPNPSATRARVKMNPRRKPHRLCGRLTPRMKVMNTTTTRLPSKRSGRSHRSLKKMSKAAPIHQAQRTHLTSLKKRHPSRQKSLQ